MTHLVKHILRTLSKFEEITRPPRMGHDVDSPHTPESHECGACGRVSPLCKPVNTWVGEQFYCPECPPYPRDGAEQLAEREAEEEVSEPSYQQCRVHHPLHPDWLCTKLFGHEDKHGYAGCFWTESPLTDDELVGVRGLLQERYEPESVEDYMARAERVESGYVIHELEDDDRLAGLAAATYSSATPPADDPAGVEHPPVPPAGPLTQWELWSASHQVDLGAAKANNKYERERLEALATRLRDASRALRK